MKKQLSINIQVKTEAIQELMKTIIEKYIFPDVAQKIHDRLDMDLQNNAYDGIDSAHARVRTKGIFLFLRIFV